MSDFAIEIQEEVWKWYETNDAYRFVKENRAPTLAEQDQVFEDYSSTGITDGKLGRWDSEYVLEKMYAIESSDLSKDEKYFLLDSLCLGLSNNYNHPIGDWSMWETVSRKMDEYI